MDASALSNSIAALRSSIRALESLSDSLEPWLYFWVTLVVIGVVLEVWFVLWAYREDFEAYHRGWIRSPQRPSRWKMFFELLGAGLVAIGVAGELGVDINAGRIQTDLRTKNGELVQLLQGVSGAAWESASKNAKEAARLAKEGEVLRSWQKTNALPGSNCKSLPDGGQLVLSNVVILLTHSDGLREQRLPSWSTWGMSKVLLLGHKSVRL